MIDQHDSVRCLAELDPGWEGEVVSLAGDRDLRTRLLELGFCPETRVRLIRRAPFGCPLEVEVGGTRFFVRRDVASHVRVRHG